MANFFNDLDDIAETRSAHVVPIVAEIKKVNNNPTNYEDVHDILILPVRNVVLLPGVTVPIVLGRDKSKVVVTRAEKTEQPLGVICQRDSDVDDPEAKDLYDEGTIAEIIKVIELPDGTSNVILHGAVPFKLKQLTQVEPYLKGEIETIQEIAPQKNDSEFKALQKSIYDVTFKILHNMGESGKELAFAIKNVDSFAHLVNFLATNIPLETKQRQKLLELHSLKERSYSLHSFLSREAQLLELKANIQLKTSEELTQQQKEHFLQQQIKTIQDELGGNGNDIKELEKRAKAKVWPDTVAEHFSKELKKLERISTQSPDYLVQYSYLDQLLNLPWQKYTKDNFNMKSVERKLNKDHYGLEKVKERILEQIAVLKLRGDMRAPILCLYGPPGVGKTSLGRSIAAALHREYVRISLGGVHDEAEIRGHRRTYVGAMPGRVMEAMEKCKSSNPVIVLDEIDKVGQDFKGDPSSALLEVLDPEQNSHFHDNYIDIDYDLSKVLFIATANSLNTISQPLLDRMELIEINGYILEEKIEIAHKHLVPKQLEETGFAAKEVDFPKPVLAKIIEDYTRESGVRELEKKIAKVLRKVALAKATGNAYYPRKITLDLLKQYLGAPEYSRDKYEGNDVAGVVTGLAWTAVGGEILFIESSLSKAGKSGDKLTLTGNLGDVMKESAVIALQYIKAHAKMLGIDYDVFDKYNVHVHVPEGSIPKDGPSAGITMVTSLVSSFTQRKVRDHLAMTGEITLRGKVLPVGGIKEKILAAKRAGITDIILSKENQKDINEIKSIYLNGLHFHYVETIKQVLDFALLDEKVSDSMID